MDYFSRRERRQLLDELVHRQILEEAVDRQRERDDHLRRRFQSIIHQDYPRRKHTRSYSHSDDDEQTKYRSGSLSHHRSNEFNESSLVTVSYHGSNRNQHGDEIIVVQRGRTLFKGFLKRGDQFTFKSKRSFDQSRVKFEFYINDLLDDRLVACCEHALANLNERHRFQVERVIGPKHCQKCQSDSDTHSSSASPSPPPPNSKTKRSVPTTNNESQSSPSRTAPLAASRQKSLTQPTENSKKSKESTSANREQKSTNGKQPEESKTKTEVKPEKKRPTTLSVPQLSVEKPSSEGFPADLSDLNDSRPLTSTRKESPPAQTEDESTRFLPIFSSTDRESPPPTKRIYGPPQVSTMLSVNEQTDFLFESSLETHDEEVTERPRLQKSESIIIEQKKDAHSDSDNDDNPRETKPSLQFLRSMSLNVETPDDAAPPTPAVAAAATVTTPSRSLASADDVTQLLLTRLGIMRQQQVEQPAPAIANAPRERGNVEYFILVYLHSIHPDETVIKRLRGLVNFLKIFNDIDECMALINNISNEKVIVVTSNSFINTLRPKIEDLHQTLAIYVLSDTDKEEEEPVSRELDQQSKIKGFYRDINEIYEQMHIDINVVSRDLVSYVNIASNSETLEPMFIYTHLLSEIILDNDETENAMKEIIQFSRQEYEGNDEELARIEEFENDYQKNRAIWWFTRQCFLSKMLNKALRIPEADVLFKLRLFIQHLHEQIRSESVVNTSLTVYLGQTIHRNDLDDLEKSSANHGLLVFSQFLFGSTDLSRAIRVAHGLPIQSDGYIPVVLHVNVPVDFKYANTSSLRYVVDDDNDVLLNMGLMVRLTKIDKGVNGIAEVHLTLVKFENERNLQRIVLAKRNEIKGAAPFVSLIKLMLMMSQQARAEQLAQLIFDDDLLKSDPNLQGSLAASCHILGATCHGRGDFKRAAELFHLSLETFLRFVPSDAAQLSPTYNNIGSMYFRQEEYAKAEEYHQKALDVQLKSTNPNLNSIASYSNNIGVVYLKQARYAEAAKCFQRSLKILLQMNLPNNSDLASTYDNLGDANLLLDKYDEALNNYSKALEIQTRIQPRSPQALASFNNSIGNVYNKLHRYADALVHFKKALECHQEYLPASHPSFASLYNNIGSMYYRQEQYAEALPYYMKSLEIEMMFLPQDHPTIAVTHFNIATTYTGLGRFDDAIAATERSVEQLLKTLPPDHPEVIENRSYIETIKRKQMLKGLFEINTTSF